MIDYSVDETRGLATCRTVGYLGFLEVAEVLRQIVGERPTYHTLVIFGDLQSFVSCTHLRPLLPLAKMWGERRQRGRVALVLPNKSALEIAQHVLRDLNLSGQYVAYFISEIAALDWLATVQNESNGSALT